MLGFGGRAGKWLRQICRYIRTASCVEAQKVIARGLLQHDDPMSVLSVGSPCMCLLHHRDSGNVAVIWLLYHFCLGLDGVKAFTLPTIMTRTILRTVILLRIEHEGSRGMKQARA